MSVHRLAIAVLAAAIAVPATAQTYRATPVTPPQQPGLRAPDADPSSVAHSAIMLRLNEIEQLARRQIVVLEYEQTTAVGETWPTASDNYGNNVNRATALCNLVLSERFGRLISYQRTFSGDVYFFHRVVCETQ